MLTTELLRKSLPTLRKLTDLYLGKLRFTTDFGGDGPPAAMPHACAGDAVLGAICACTNYQVWCSTCQTKCLPLVVKAGLKCTVCLFYEWK